MLTAHGRMGRGCAEEAVAAFAEGKSDVLLATTVIENGIDIPSVNTIVVMHAHTFGMSTLYQLRGRVGRSNKQAYAFMFYPEESSITEAAYLRLKAMQVSAPSEFGDEPLTPHALPPSPPRPPL